ncbi:MAG: acyl-CoA dehydrogenase family protein [Deltaproteobacteria bacterium]|nr:acyl-CoA dehydrogenase family protein [Deltaproteobacteria bacterium]
MSQQTLQAPADAASWLSATVDGCVSALAARVTVNGKLSRERLDALQAEASELARTLAEREAARAMLAYAERLGDPLSAGLAATYVALVTRRMLERLLPGGAFYGAAAATLPEAVAAFLHAAGSPEQLLALSELLYERTAEPTGPVGLGPDHREMRDLFARFADEKLAPVAEHIHRDDKVVPEPLLKELAALGVFGISIPESYGGSFVDHLTMCIATEELSRGSLGAGGSVITRPEICSKAILGGGTEEQKAKWLPEIASGERLVSVAVTEPNAGSDVAAVRVSARKVEGGYLINGEKTWCTFAGRADTFVLLARTGRLEDGPKGLTMFLAEKPAVIGGDESSFRHTQPGGGTVEGHAIPTIGYRGMHSFAVQFEDYFVPDSHRVGREGEGFALQMKGFAGGRIQTAARAVGVMEAAYRQAISYARDRQVFGEPLANFGLSRQKLVLMAAMIQASRQLSYHVAGLMDDHKGGMEASLVKLLSCKDAEWVTREAMQLHGGMGYSEEYAVSRLWQDARVLSIFEGAEEILAVYVVARGVLREKIEGVAG